MLPGSMRIGEVTPYPPPNEKHVRASGVASYAKNLMTRLRDKFDLAVLAEAAPGIQAQDDEGIRVIPCWSKGPKYLVNILSCARHNDIRALHVQHETFLFGSFLSAAMFPLLPLMFRLSSRRTIITMHGVMPLRMIDESFLRENRINGNPFIMRAGIKVLTKLTVMLSHHIIVHEEVLKNWLVEDYGCDGSRITVIPHGIEPNPATMDQRMAKDQLGLEGGFFLLFLGYITGYKNVQLLIEAMAHLDKDTVLIIAGGEHPRLSEDPDYRAYLETLHRKADEIAPGRVIFKGFLPESEIPAYMALSDLLVFPYNVCMSTSGPLSMAMAYHKLFLVSEAFREVVDLPDAIFPLDPEGLAEKVTRIRNDGSIQERMAEYIARMNKEHSWDSVAARTGAVYDKVFGSEYRRSTRPLPSSGPSESVR